MCFVQMDQEVNLMRNSIIPKPSSQPLVHGELTNK